MSRLCFLGQQMGWERSREGSGGVESLPSWLTASRPFLGPLGVSSHPQVSLGWDPSLVYPLPDPWSQASLDR